MKQPTAHNKTTGESYPVIGIDYTVQGDLNKVIVLVSEPHQDVKLEFWSHVDSPFAEYNGEHAQIVDFEILIDGVII